MTRTKKYVARMSVSDGGHAVGETRTIRTRTIDYMARAIHSRIRLFARHDRSRAAAAARRGARRHARHRRARPRACSTRCARRRSRTSASRASTRTAQLRQGFPEVILGIGKTPAQIAAIAERIVARGQSLLVTRATAGGVRRRARGGARRRVSRGGARDHAARRATSPPGTGTVLVACAGTSDLPVAEEAAVTAELMGNTVDRLYDVGVAGLHRLLPSARGCSAARVIIVVAGMEGALPSVVAGLVQAPVIAVPTSVGYGASFGGIAALLGMLNSCANGVSVVNIDNGFGAACVASPRSIIWLSRISEPSNRSIANPVDADRVRYLQPSSSMHAGALRALEFDRIVSVVAGLAVTPTGRDRLAELHPMTDAARSSPRSGDDARARGSSPITRAFRCARRRTSRRSSTALGVEGRALEPLRLLGLADYLESIEQSRSAVTQVGTSRFRFCARWSTPSRRSRARSPTCGARSSRRARWPTTPARRSPASASGCASRSAACGPRSSRSCAGARRRSTCRSRSSPIATAATC